MENLEAVNVGVSRFKNLISSVGMEEKQHQIDGVSWCIKNEVLLNKGGLIADEMGLGKTLQMLGVIHGHSLSRTLIVVPLALLDQWKLCIYNFLKQTPIVFHGYAKRNITVSQLESASVVLTTYGQISLHRGQKRTVHSVNWDRVCFDEAHHLRNPRTGLHKGAIALQCSIRWLMTGTPIQNSKRDFYSLCAAIGLDPSYYTKQANLLDLVRTYIMKRTKKSIGLELPELSSMRENLLWESKEEALLAEQIHSSLEFSNVSWQRGNKLSYALGRHKLSMMIRARQCCILPDLIGKQVSKLEEEGLIDIEEEAKAGLTGTSKLEQVCKKIIQRKNNGRGKLIFCHYRREIDFVHNQLTKANMSVSAFDGRTAHKERNSILTSDWEALILQIQTGCEGLNLQQFSEVYFISPHWNPAVEDQAVARCHRIGQKQPIDVFRFAMNGFSYGESDCSGEFYTLDQYSHEKQEHKRELAREILG
jgi:SNF2 family DNA or RNA helicase